MSSMNDVARLKDIDNLADQTAQAINYLAQNGGSSSAVSGSNVLDTVPATVDGGFWYEVVDGAPIVKFHYGGKDFALSSSRVLPKGLVSWLTFNDANNPLKDECGIEWVVTPATEGAEPTITVNQENAFCGNALQFTGDFSLSAKNPIPLGGKDFTVHFWFYDKSTTDTSSNFVHFIFYDEELNDYFFVCIKFNSTIKKGVLTSAKPYITANNTDLTGDTQMQTSIDIVGKLAHLALVYVHNEEQLAFYIDGVLQGSVSISIPRKDYSCILASDSGGNRAKGSFDEFMIYDGVALWTDEFTPPTADDY